MPGDSNTYQWVEDVLAFIGGLILAGVIGLAILFGWTSVTWPHSFYEPACCSGHDCAPIEKYRVDHVSGGYLVDGLHFVPENQARNSPDGLYHACYPLPARNLRCFYRPPMSM